MNPWRNAGRGWALLGAFVALSAVFIMLDESYVPDLSGRWTSAGCEAIASPGGGLSRLTRDYVFADDAWRMDLTFFGDQDCRERSFSLSVEGHYALGAKSPTIPGATRVRFAMERLKLTPYTDEMAAVFSRGNCGGGPWLVGIGQDVTEAGCLQGIPSVRSCPAEYDVVKREGDSLRLGDRSRSLCVPGAYPAKLGAAPLTQRL